MTSSAWSPLHIGSSTLQHRVVLAPLTRNRGTASTNYERTWVPNELMKQYYTERATPGGLLITEATPVSRVASGVAGIPGTFTEEQLAGWKQIVDAVHAKGGIFFCQIWHQGRTTHSCIAGQTPVSSSDVSLQGNFAWNDVPPIAFEKPHPLTVSEIQDTQADFVRAAENAIKAGFDGVEIHAGNGYLFDQFHHSNINLRNDEYGGSIERRCRFTLETVEKICDAIGAGRLGVRLSPFALFNESFGEDRVEQWTYLCTELNKKGLAYVHLIEPRFDEFKTAAEKYAEMPQVKAEDLTLGHFKKVLTKTPLMAAGGYSPTNFEESLQNGSCDLVAFGRFYIANADLVERLKSREPLYKWDRSRFYGPFPDNEIGYTQHPHRTFADMNDILKPQLAA